MLPGAARRASRRRPSLHPGRTVPVLSGSLRKPPTAVGAGQRSRATVTPHTPIAPAASRGAAHAERVAPVVTTSSTRTTQGPESGLGGRAPGSGSGRPAGAPSRKPAVSPPRTPTGSPPRTPAGHGLSRKAPRTL